MDKNTTKNSPFFSFFESTRVKYVALTILMMLEWCWGILIDTEMSLFNMHSPCYKYSLYVLSVTFAIWFFTGIIIKVYKLPGIRIITHFLDYSAGKNILTALLLVAFVMNFTWSMNILYSLFFTYGNTINEIYHLIITLCSLIIVAYIFPNDIPNIPLDKRDIIISSASFDKKVNEIVAHNLEGMFKMFDPGIEISFNGNEEPLPNIREFHIIPSNEYLKAQISTDILTSSPEFTRLVKEYNSNELSENDKLEKLSSIYENYLKEKYEIEEVTIKIHPPIDYNDNPNNGLETVDKILKNLKGSNNAIVAISPGTAIIASIMSMIAIQGNRLILYIRQDSDKIAIYDPEIQTISRYLEEKVTN